jgi:hypothetical protein
MMIEIANYIIYYPAQASTYLWGAVIFSFASTITILLPQHTIYKNTMPKRLLMGRLATWIRIEIRTKINSKPG